MDRLVFHYLIAPSRYLRLLVYPDRPPVAYFPLNRERFGVDKLEADPEFPNLLCEYEPPHPLNNLPSPPVSKTSFLAYCKLDTQAMIDLVDALQALTAP